MTPHAMTRRQLVSAGATAFALGALGRVVPARAEPFPVSCPPAGWVPSYPDGRPVATLRMDAVDQGVVLLHGDGPDQCDIYGARDVWVFEHDGTYYMHYDAAGPTGWLSALATSPDGVHWTKHGTVLELGAPGSDDSASASYGVTYLDGDRWHMYYLGTPNTTPPPDRIPSFPYLTMKAWGEGPVGPWHKQPDVVPFRPEPGTYHSATASPGHVVRAGDEFLQFYSASTNDAGTRRTIGIARTRDLDGAWAIDPQPVVPLEEQVENSSLYFEPANRTWFLFTNHVGLEGGEFTDAIWVYWTQDLERWNPDDKAVVLDRNNCAWSQRVVGLPSVLPIGGRLAVFYDGVAGASTSHMGRDVGVAWLDLPLHPPRRGGGPPNLALGATATASTTYPGYDAARVVDGSPSTGLGEAHSWANEYMAPMPQWVQLDFDRPTTFGRVDLYTTSGFELREYRLQIWDGGWVDCDAPVSGNTNVLRTHRFEPVTTTHLRVLCTSGSDQQPTFARINEIEVYAPPGPGCG
jgi:predicted GH43/DUF377 family glycosyl hydrolase